MRAFPISIYYVGENPITPQNTPYLLYQWTDPLLLFLATLNYEVDYNTSVA